MCGILGYTHLSRHLPAQVLGAALKSLDHRGPDQCGRFVSESVSLGATRLRITDLHGGDQPLRSADGDLALVFNGEIFNHRELRAELERDGFRFDTDCDTEVVLQAFRRWGADCFPRLRGMFAIAIWEQSRRRLVLARDRMGIKPLYYRLQDGELFFGSELKCILAHPGVPRRICLEGLDCYLNLNYVPAPFTLVEGIRKLLPGHFLEWNEGRSTIHGFVPPAAPPVARNIEDACTELDQLLENAVREQLVSDVPIGLWLSGGLDSSAILHYAAKVHPEKINTFSLTFRGRSFDESAYIRQISDQFGTNHTECDLNGDADLEEAIEQLAYYSDEPSADAGALPAWFLARMTRRNVTVVLTGEGSDELFGGYLTYKADRYAQRARKLPRLLRRAAGACAGLLPVSDEKIGLEYKLKRFLAGSLLSPEAAHTYWNGTFSEAEKRELCPYVDGTALRSVLNGMPTGSGIERFLAFDQRYYLPDDILYKVDRVSMAHSLEVRPPFLDHRIVDFAAQLPESFKLRGGTSKYVLRRLMRDKIPQSVLLRPKIGFDIPVHDWFRGPLRSFLFDTLSEDAVAQTGLFHWPAVERLLREHTQRKANWGYHLWGLMVLLIWMKHWNIEFAAQPRSLEAPAAEALAVGSL